MGQNKLQLERSAAQFRELPVERQKLFEVVGRLTANQPAQ